MIHLLKQNLLQVLINLLDQNKLLILASFNMEKINLLDLVISQPIINLNNYKVSQEKLINPPNLILKIIEPDFNLSKMTQLVINHKNQYKN